MTIEQKRDALLDMCCGFCDGCRLSDEETCDVEGLPADEINRLYNKAFPTKDNTAVTMPNYEAEYYRLSKENAKLRVEVFSLRETIIEMCKTFFKEYE